MFAIGPLFSLGFLLDTSVHGKEDDQVCSILEGRHQVLEFFEWCLNYWTPKSRPQKDKSNLEFPMASPYSRMWRLTWLWACPRCWGTLHQREVSFCILSFLIILSKSPWINYTSCVCILVGTLRYTPGLQKVCIAYFEVRFCGFWVNRKLVAVVQSVTDHSCFLRLFVQT